jgi:predicted dehydrogenase
MEPLRIGVIGLGFGQHYVRTLVNLPGAHLAAVADNRPALPGGLAAFAAHYGTTAYDDGITMMETEKLDAVCLCVAPRWREPLIECAARRGLPMMVEKPWAANLTQARRLAELCRKHQARVMAGFSFRFHPAVVKLRSLIDNELGPGWLLNGEYVFDWRPPAEHWLWDPANGNGFFNENSCHLFDVVCHLLGRPTTVMAETINPLHSPSAEAAAITLRFANGAVAALTVGCLGAAGRHDFPRLDLVAANGQARLIGRDHVWEQAVWTLRGRDDVHTLVQPPEELGSTRYTHALNHFCECVRTGQTPSAGIDDGVTMVALAEAVYESARTGNKVRLEIEKHTGSV